jgi:hypothetical protein
MPKIKISLTDFIDFVNKSGNPKLTKVRQIKNRESYHPSRDFYKGLREGIIKIHEEELPKNELFQVLDNIRKESKKEIYEKAIHGYIKFWGNKKIKWFSPVTTTWKSGEVEVKINPELGLKYGTKTIIIKLYFKSEELSKSRVAQILSLLEIQLRKKVSKECVFGVLDIKKSKLHFNTKHDKSLLPLLEGEIRSFETIWKAI